MNWVAGACALGGFSLIGYGWWISYPDWAAKRRIASAVGQQLKAPSQGLGQTTAPQGLPASGLPGTADFVRGLAELAKPLAQVSPPIAAFIISAILFFLAAAVTVIRGY
jgi:hypothetical protein